MTPASQVPHDLANNQNSAQLEALERHNQELEAENRRLVAELAEQQRAHARLTAAVELGERRFRLVEAQIGQLNQTLNRRVAELQTLLDLLPVGVCVAHDASAESMSINPVGAKMLNVSVEDNPSKTGPQADRLPFTVQQQGHEVPGSELPMQYATTYDVSVGPVELDFVHAGGRVLKALVYASPLHDEQGQVRGSVGVFVDITALKQAEQAVRQSEQQIRLITDAVPALIAYVDKEERYRFNNRAYETWFGFSSTDLAGKQVKDRLGPAAYEAVRPYLEKVLRGERVSYEQLIPYGSGGARYVQAHYIPDVSETGEVRGYVSLVHDFTERKQLEETLRESEARFRMMADNAPVLIWIAGPDKGCTYFNRLWREFTGRTLEQELGFGWAQGIHPNDYDRCLATYIAAFEARRPFEMEYRLGHHAGEHRWIVDRGTPLFKGDDFAGYIGSCIDIHERKQVELAEHLLAETGKVLSSALDLADRLRRVSWLAVPHLADWCAVDLYEENWTVHHIAVAHSDPAMVELGRELQRRYLPRPEVLAEEAQPWQQGHSQLIPEITDEMLQAGAQDEEHYQILHSLNLRSAMVVPLMARGRVLGIIAFFWAESNNRYSEQDLALAEELAHRVGLALDNARLYEAEQQARQTAEQTAERLAGLQAVTAALSEALTPAQVASLITKHGLPVLGAAGGVVTRLNEAGTELEILHFDGYSPVLMAKWGQRIPVTIPSPLTEVTHSGQPIFIESLAEREQRYPHLAERAVSSSQAFAALPLSVEGHAIGVLGLSFGEAKHFTEAEREFMLTLASQCAQALERARLYEIEQQARLEAEANQQRLALLAEMRERNRLAQELHDNVAQALGYLNLKLTLTHELLMNQQTPAALENVQELKQIVGEAYTDIRGEIFNLRTGPAAKIDFLETLRDIVDKYRRFYQLEVELVFEAEADRFGLPSDVAAPLVRTIQEALMNVCKHAGVKEVTLRLGYEAGQVRIRIEDKGRGFEFDRERTTRYGLTIMQERMASIGGQLEIDSAPGKGTQVKLLWQNSTA